MATNEAINPLGTKRICPKCGAKFYDLNKNPAKCPKCSHSYDPSVAVKPRRGRRKDSESNDSDAKIEVKKPKVVKEKDLPEDSGMGGMDDDLGILEDMEDLADFEDLDDNESVTEEEVDESVIDDDLGKSLIDSIDEDEFDEFEDEEEDDSGTNAEPAKKSGKPAKPAPSKGKKK